MGDEGGVIPCCFLKLVVAVLVPPLSEARDLEQGHLMVEGNVISADGLPQLVFDGGVLIHDGYGDRIDLKN